MHYASAVFEGERAYEGKVFKLTEHSQRLRRSAELLGFKIPYSVAEIDAATGEAVKRSGFTDCLCPPDRLARQRADGRLGAAEHRSISPSRSGNGRPISRPESAEQGHPHDLRQMAPALARDRAHREQGRRALHDLHALQARGRGRRLRRCADARLARPDRRSDRAPMSSSASAASCIRRSPTASSTASPGARSSSSPASAASR